ncbi:MAG: hypothetical protein ACOH2D_07530 [Gelidibacter sp.]
MKNLLYILLFASASLFCQEKMIAIALDEIPINADHFIAIDNFGTQFYTNGNTFYKEDPQQIFNYTNVQLGNITSANAFNPLKINLLYKNFNTVVVLDNRLSEIYKIDFNTIQPYKNVTHISTGFDTTLWIFNQDLQQLELFDYKTNKTRTTAMPVESNVLDLESNYNYVWLLTEKFLYKYNYFGSMISKMENDHFIQISEDNGNLVIQKNDGLYFLAKDNDQLIAIKLPNLLIKQFLLTNESLYICTDETLHHFQLKIR